MTIAYWCVLIAAFMPILWTAYAKFAGPGFDNHQPRDFLAKLEGPRARAHAAQQNAFEAFPPFAAGVIIAHLVGAEQAIINGLAIAFLVFRLLYGICYITDQALLRSLVWALAVLCVIGLFVAGV